MHPCAPHRAHDKGRPWPSFFHAGLVLLVLVSPPLTAQTAPAPDQPVYRCGQVYTNAPADPAACARLPLPALTTIEGTRSWPSAPASTSAAEASRPSEPRTRQSQAQARSILLSELQTSRQRLEALQQEYQQGEPEKWASESHNHQKYLDRVAALKAAIERTGRDIDSLQRELARQSAP